MCRQTAMLQNGDGDDLPSKVISCRCVQELPNRTVSFFVGFFFFSQVISQPGIDFPRAAVKI